MLKYSNEGVKFVKCPFDPNHIIRAHRLPYHIVKCKKNHPEVNLVNCVYNYSHLTKKEDFLEHLETCPNKCRIDAGNYDDSTLEHDSCPRLYGDPPETETDTAESFYLVSPLEKRSSDRKEQLDYLTLQEKNVPRRPSDNVLHEKTNPNTVKTEDLASLEQPGPSSKASDIKK